MDKNAPKKVEIKLPNIKKRKFHYLKKMTKDSLEICPIKCGRGDACYVTPK